MVMFDSLNRNMLPPYGGDWIHAPNFERLEERTVTFDKAYIGSMPCMPARRELHTGRYNFLHRSWGPIEPFDDSMPEILKNNGVYTHLVTDHGHYFEDGGSTYHNRYSSWEFNRGQEGDTWKGYIDPPFEIPPEARHMESNQSSMMWKQEFINRHYMPTTESQPQVQTFNQGLDFIRNNHQSDRWFLQIETFDPHEPFFTHEEFKALYPHEYDATTLDWITYGQNHYTTAQAAHLQYEYAALVSLCDAQLGRLIDVMDELNLWDDTLLIVCTDHGLLLGQHDDHWGKNIMPWFNENANTPLFIWHPHIRKHSEHRQSIVQMIDIPATLLEYFGVDLPSDMHGVSLSETIMRDKPVRDAALFGSFGSQVNVTDGRYIYMRAPVTDNQPLNEYTLMPTHIRTRFTVSEIQQARFVEPFDFTKNCPLMQIPGKAWGNPFSTPTVLYDLENDPQQSEPIMDDLIEKRMIEHILKLMKKNDAPDEQFERLGLSVHMRNWQD